MTNTTHIRTLAATVMTAAAIHAATPAMAEDYAGLWYDHNGSSAIEINHCGAGLCGRIVWLKTASGETCGLSIIGGGERAGESFDSGWIYDPKGDRRYSVELTLLGEGKLKVLGYAGSKLFSKTMIWNRAPDNLERCG